MNLYPTFEVPDIDLETADQESFQKSYDFDFEVGEFVSDGGNKVQKSESYVAWAQWCIKAVQIERFSCLAYSSDVGIESEDIRRQDTREGSESVFEKTITEALKVHVNTESVQNFVFEWENGSIIGSFTIYPVQGMPIDVNATINL